MLLYIYTCSYVYAIEIGIVVVKGEFFVGYISEAGQVGMRLNFCGI